MTDPVVVLDGSHREPDRGKPRSRRKPWPWRRGPVVVVAVIAILVSASAALVLRDRSGDSRTGPPPNPPGPPAELPVLGRVRNAYDGDLGDPFVLPITDDGGRVVRFIAFGTGDWPAAIPTGLSPDLVSWEKGPDALPDLPAWAAPNPRHSLSWAPAVLDTPNGYILYATLPDASSGDQCIAAATSTVPEGPYAVVGDRPLLCQHELGGSIDPSIVRDGAGRLHLLWKDEGNTLGLPTSIWEQRLGDDGLGVEGSPRRMHTASQPWQGGIIENPAVIPATGGGWWLFYSGNVFDRPEYATGIAWCADLGDVCQEVQPGPFIDTAGLGQSGQFAPGGLETFRDADGALWAVLHTWNRPTRNGRFYCCRSLQMAPVVRS